MSESKIDDEGQTDKEDEVDDAEDVDENDSFAFGDIVWGNVWMYMVSSQNMHHHQCT